MVFDQEGKNIKLNEGEFNTVGALSWEIGVNTLTKTPGGVVNLLQGWILETPKKVITHTEWGSNVRILVTVVERRKWKD